VINTERNDLKGRFILVHSERSFCPWLIGSIVFGMRQNIIVAGVTQCMVARQQRERQKGDEEKPLQGSTPSHLLPLARPHLLKFSPSPKRVTPARDAGLNT
jgi:hypothetical protein